MDKEITDEDLELLRRLLKEHLQAFVLIGFDLAGNQVRACEFETKIQGYAIAEAIRSELNCNAQALEVFVRNLI